MSARWWAPRAASLTPDPVVLALLDSDGESAGDLGAVVLAAHRAGAAACAHVAASGLVSKAALISVLASTRAQLADPMVTAIAKSMDSSYAGLLVRDVFDDAEDAALTLYGAAVARNVSPSQAALRVGAVFGVPTAAMGRYQPLAMDPKANPAALADAADRALMGHVAKLVATETATETVTKAATALMDFDPREHPRGLGGQFVHAAETSSILQPHVLAELRSHFGGGGQTPPQVGPKDKVTRKTRKTRKVRRTRAVTPKAKTKTLTRTLTKPLSARTLALHRGFTRMNERKLEGAERTMPPLLSFPDPGQRTAGDTNYYEVSYPLAFGAPGPEDNDFHVDLRVQAQEQHKPGTAIFRIGHLLNKIGNPDPEIARHDNPKIGNPQGTGQIDELAQQAIKFAELTGYVEPKVRSINFMNRPTSPTGQFTALEIEQWLENTRQEEFKSERTLRSGAVVTENNATEDDFTKLYPQYIPMGPGVNEEDYSTMYVVHYQPANKNKIRVRPQPAITEYVIGDSAIGEEEGLAEDKMSFTLDPNTAYKIVPGGGVPYATYDQGQVEPVTMWDDKRKVVVHRYWLRPIDEDEVEEILGPEVAKAETTFKETSHPRNAFGQWVNAQMTGHRAEQPAEPVARKTRQVRRTRKTRKTRQTHQEMAGTTPTLRRSLTTTRTSLAQQQMGRSMKAAMTTKSAGSTGREPLPPLSDLSDYLLFSDNAPVFTPGEDWTPNPGQNMFQYITDAIDNDDLAKMLANPGTPIKLFSTARDRITTSDYLRSKDLGARMNFNVESELVSQDDGQAKWVPLDSIPYTPVLDVNATLSLDEDGAELDQALIVEKMAKIFDNNPGTDQVQLVHRGDRLVFLGNTRPSSPQHIVEIDASLDPDGPMEMQFLGEYRAHDIRLSVDDAIVDTLVSIEWDKHRQNVVDPKLHVFKVTNPVARRYSVHNS